MSKLNFGTALSLNQCAKLIANTPKVRFLLRGEPGIGKTALLKMLAKELPDYKMVYIDVPNLDLGDISMPVIDRETKTTTYYPNARFGVHTGEKVCIVLDEFTKGADPVKNMLHPMLNEGRLGDVTLHEDDIIFMTGNLGSDGVGDMLKAHTKNRITPITVKKPMWDEWTSWGIDNDIDPTLLAFSKQYPHIFDSYTDSHAQDNPYIFNPKRQQEAFVSPRSLEKASFIVKSREFLDSDTIVAALAGTCGEAFAKDFNVYLECADQLPTKESVIKTPRTAKIPESTAAQSIMIYGAIAWVEKDTLAPFMEYIERLPAEWQAVFCINLAKSKKQNMAFQNRQFSEWVAKNQDLL
jgi:hypothetical protein